MNTLHLPLEAKYHHLHLASPDSEASARWYGQHLGGKHHSVGDYQLALFENNFLIWYRSETVAPSVGGVLDHFGFSVPKVEPVLKAMLDDGAELLTEPTVVGPENLKIAFVNDPWGAKLELLEDPDLLGIHHVHLLVPDIEQHREWLGKRLGGEPQLFKGMLAGLRFDQFWILFREGDAELAQSKGRAIDHIGFRVEDIEAATRALTDAGANLDGPPRDVGDLHISFIVDSMGVRYELVTPKSSV